MKRYKLLKEFPGLPEELNVGDIVSRKHTDAFYHGSENKCVIHRKEVEGYPKFWKKLAIIPEGIRIERFFNSFANAYWVVTANGYYRSSGGIEATIDFMLEHSDYNISSIVRLSDNKTFSIGDTVQAGDIESIKLLDGKIEITTRGIMGICILYDIENLKKVIFKSEEDYDMHVGDTYWFVIPDELTVYNNICPDFDVSKLPGLHKRFKYEDNAREYINNMESRKVIFSSDDGCDMYEGDEYWFVTLSGGVIPNSIHPHFDLNNLPDDNKRFKYKSNADDYANKLKAKKVIFESQDGFDMYKGDKYWFVTKVGSIHAAIVNSDPMMWRSPGINARFKHEVHARAYADKLQSDKVKYTKNDIKYAYKQARAYSSGPFDTLTRDGFWAIINKYK